MRNTIGLVVLIALVLGFSGCEDAADKKARAELKIETGLDLSASEYKIYLEKEKEAKKQKLLRTIEAFEYTIESRKQSIVRYETLIREGKNEYGGKGSDYDTKLMKNKIQERKEANERDSKRLEEFKKEYSNLQ
jgi:hypothetical protein